MTTRSDHHRRPQAPMRKPKGSRNCTVDDKLYYWWTIGSDSDPNGHHVIIVDPETRKRHKIEWGIIARADDGGPFYPILPKHVAAYIRDHIQKGS